MRTLERRRVSDCQINELGGCGVRARARRAGAARRRRAISPSRPPAATSCARRGRKAKILARRRPIAAIVADPATPPTLARQARARARRARLRRATRSGSTRSRASRHISQLDRDTLVLVLSGAYRDKLEAVHVVVSRSSAACRTRATSTSPRRKAAARQLDGRGLRRLLAAVVGVQHARLVQRSAAVDVAARRLARPGEHGDPRADAQHLLRAGQAVFNESFANFVGARGSAWFFRSRGSAGGGRRRRTRAGPTRRCSARFWASLYAESTRRSRRIPATTRRARRAIALRDTVYARARATLVDVLGPQLRDDRRRARCERDAAGQRGADGASDLSHGSRSVRRVWAARRTATARDDRADHRAGEVSEGPVRRGTWRSMCCHRRRHDCLSICCRGDRIGFGGRVVPTSRRSCAMTGLLAPPNRPRISARQVHHRRRARRRRPARHRRSSTTTRCIFSRTPRSRKRDSWSNE